MDLAWYGLVEETSVIVTTQVSKTRSKTRTEQTMDALIQHATILAQEKSSRATFFGGQLHCSPRECYRLDNCSCGEKLICDHNNPSDTASAIGAVRGSKCARNTLNFLLSVVAHAVRLSKSGQEDNDWFRWLR